MNRFAFLSAIAKGYTSEQAQKHFLVLDRLSKSPDLSDEARLAINFVLAIIYRLMGSTGGFKLKIVQLLKEANERGEEF